MKVTQTGGGYFYKIYKNGKKVRISKEKFMKLKGNKQRGGNLNKETNVIQYLIIKFITGSKSEMYRKVMRLRGQVFIKNVINLIGKMQLSDLQLSYNNLPPNIKKDISLNSLNDSSFEYNQDQLIIKLINKQENMKNENITTGENLMKSITPNII